MVHLLSGNIAEVIVLILGLSFLDADGLSVYPLSTIQILWINMVTSTPPVRSGWVGGWREERRFECAAVGLERVGGWVGGREWPLCLPSLHHSNPLD